MSDCVGFAEKLSSVGRLVEEVEPRSLMLLANAITQRSAAAYSHTDEHSQLQQKQQQQQQQHRHRQEEQTAAEELQQPVVAVSTSPTGQCINAMSMNCDNSAIMLSEPQEMPEAVENSGVTTTTTSSSPPPTSTNTLGVIVNCQMPQQPQQPQQQSSPPPHSYRHSRSYRHFKNPPQPHMCIRTTTIDTGEELFINVLSWTRIVIPQEPSDPIPLYGGMRVPPGSPRSPAIVFAVMANPEVLKDSGRHSKDPEERRAMVELMCDFVEAMNPGVKLVRNAVILKDRDISGELKDVWNAVQAQRDREREEQIMQQRHQLQHFQNLTTQQLFPKTADAIKSATATASAPVPADAQISACAESNEASVVVTATTPASVAHDTTTTTSPPATTTTTTTPLSNGADIQTTTTTTTTGTSAISPPLSPLCQQYDNKMIVEHPDVVFATTTTTTATTNNKHNSNGHVADGDKLKVLHQNGGGGEHAADHNGVAPSDDDVDQIDAKVAIANTINSTQNSHVTAAPNSTMGYAAATGATATATATTAPVAVATTPSLITNSVGTAGNAAVVHVAAPTPAPTKKEKLGGFLPNGCIFPRFKNNRHKDKDKEKESKPPKDKEKTLLNALKKSKDKKIAPIEHSTTTTTPTPTSGNDQPPQTQKVDMAMFEAKSQYEKNCINLESEVEKLDLNKIDNATTTTQTTTTQTATATSGNNDTNNSIFIKLKTATTTST